MKILVTGGDGFIGRHLIPQLIGSGHEVICASRKEVEQIPWRAIADLRTPTDWSATVEGVEAVIHLANLAHRKASDEELDAVNRRATVALCQAARRAGVRHFIYVSSIGAQSGHSSAHVLTEDDAPTPTSPYGRSKLRAEQEISAIDIPTTVLRPVLVIGEDAKGNARTLNQIAQLPLPLPVGGITAKRSFLSVENFATALLTVLDEPLAFNQSYILADENPISVADLIAWIRHKQGRHPGIFSMPGVETSMKLLAGPIWEKIGMPLVASPRKLMSLGWKPCQGY